VTGQKRAAVVTKLNRRFQRRLSLWKKPRRVRARRREENEIRFPRRHVRRGKHFSAEQCASWPPQADSECAHEAAAFPVEKGKAFFDGLNRR
jgi:hypothetical protein